MALTALKVERLKDRGRYGDGNGLWLQISKWGTKSWLFRYTLRGKAREMGLGAVAAISLAEARALALEARRLLWNGVDPIMGRQVARAQQAAEEASAITFKQAAMAAMAAREGGWDNEEHRRQWKRSLEVYCYPAIGPLQVWMIDTGLVLKCVEPIWTTKRVTAERIRGRIEAILDWATARGYRKGDNPARWKGHLQHLLPVQGAAVKPMKALPYGDVPAFMARLRQREGITARALEYTILTTTRTGEAINTKWSEIDGATWTVPPERMKGTKDKRREHRVPLSTAALALLRGLPRVSDYVFPGRSEGPLHPKAMGELLRAMNVPATVHGFRSSFKDWASESTSYANEISEMALAHQIPHKVERAYRRGDLFGKRSRLMEDWAAFCGRPVTEAADVVPIRSGDRQ